MNFDGLVWILILFVFTFSIGIFAPIAGIGGGVLWVPIVMAFFPFHVDFVRGAGLVMALTTSLSSAPRFTRSGLANLKLMIPVVAVSVPVAAVGGLVGLWVTKTIPAGQQYIAILLGIIVFVAFLFMLTSKRSEFPEVKRQDSLSRKLDISGNWYENSIKKIVEYRVTNMPVALLAFALVGFIAGTFGVGCGWANVVVLNLIMLTPIKVATSTSMLIISMTEAAAASVYLAKGAVLPIIVIPTVIGMTIGARIGTKIAVKARPASVRYIVMGFMVVAAVIDIVKGVSGLGFF